MGGGGGGVFAKEMQPGSEINFFIWEPTCDLKNIFSRQKFSLENACFELLYGYQKATTARSCVCVKHHFSLSKADIFGEKMYPTSNVIEKSICPLTSLLKFPATKTPVTFCRTQAAMLLPCYIPRTSPLNLFTESLFFRPQYIFYEEPRKKVAACDVVKVVNGKTPSIFISKTSAR